MKPCYLKGHFQLSALFGHIEICHLLLQMQPHICALIAIFHGGRGCGHFRLPTIIPGECDCSHLLLTTSLKRSPTPHQISPTFLFCPQEDSEQTWGFNCTVPQMAGNKQTNILAKITQTTSFQVCWSVCRSGGSQQPSYTKIMFPISLSFPHLSPSLSSVPLLLTWY